MKKAWLSIITLATLVVLGGCKTEKEGGNETTLDYKKLTEGTAVYQSEENGLQRYVVTLWTNEGSIASGNDYSKDGISLKLDLITTASAAKNSIASGDYSFSSNASEANTILDSEDSALKIVTTTSYGAQYERLVSGDVSVNSYNGTYEIKGEVQDSEGNVLKFDYYGVLAFSGNAGDTPRTITFENAELAAETGAYSNILWGKEKASDVEGVAVYNGLLYTEGSASFGSYFSESEYGDMWGGFAVSSNNNLEDLGMDYSNQFSVYAPRTTKFALGYIFGDYGGSYGNPVIEFSEPVTIASADIANANKTYHYCVAHTQVGADDAPEDIWVNLILHGYNGENANSSTATISLAKGKEVLGDWKNFDLSSLGQVTKVTFTMESNDMGEYGLNVPAFFCIDNIAFE